MKRVSVWVSALGICTLTACGGVESQADEKSTAVSNEAVVSALTCAPGFNMFVGPPPAGALPFVPLASLKTVPNPVLGPPNPRTGAPTVRGDLTSYIIDAPSAIQLGKAFFWEMQAGSDNKVSCATCHFQAGQDTRAKNQLNPGFNNSFDGLSTNYSFTAANFPFV